MHDEQISSDELLRQAQTLRVCVPPTAPRCAPTSRSIPTPTSPATSATAMSFIAATPVSRTASATPQTSASGICRYASSQTTRSGCCSFYLRARWYDRTTAQFSTTAPLQAITHEPYADADAYDNPLNSTDPTGLDVLGIGNFISHNARPPFGSVKQARTRFAACIPSGRRPIQVAGRTRIADGMTDITLSEVTKYEVTKLYLAAS